MPHGGFAAFKETLARKKARDVKKKSIYDNKHQVSKRTRKKTEFNFPKLTASELETAKLNIRKKLKKDRRKRGVMVVVIFIIILSLILNFIINPE